MSAVSVLSWTALGLAFASSASIVVDIYLRANRQSMRVMEAVWPITALYLGPIALWAYGRYGRRVGSRSAAEHGHGEDERGPRWAGVAVTVSHCGAGCVLGDIVAEFAVFVAGLTIADSSLPAEYIGDFVLAVVFGLLFQYLSIAPGRGLKWRARLSLAAQADILSLTAYEVGLFGWMALMAFVFFPAPHHLTVDSAEYWVLMQAGMIIGFITSWPANIWLINHGIMQPM